MPAYPDVLAYLLPRAPVDAWIDLPTLHMKLTPGTVTVRQERAVPEQLELSAEGASSSPRTSESRTSPPSGLQCRARRKDCDMNALRADVRAPKSRISADLRP
jgi:hypothetical protein